MGDGNDIDFWKEQWLGIEPLFKVFPLLFDGREQQHISGANFGYWLNDSWRWAVPWLHLSDLIITGEGDILSSILQQVSPTRGKKDEWIWPHDPSKNFLVKSFYLQLVRSDYASNDSDPRNFWESLWKTAAPSKVLLFGWWLFLNSLPLRDELLYRNILHSTENALCHMCTEYSETLNHLFSSCTFANSVWSSVSAWLGLVLDSSLDIVDLFILLMEN